MKLCAKIASLVVSRNNCIKRQANKADALAREWEEKHEDMILDLVEKYMPHGSGFDDRVRINLNVSNANRLVFNTLFHHMDENGSYDGWTEHCVRVYPAFDGVRMTITGIDKNDIKDYIYECFDIALNKEVQ